MPRPPPVTRATREVTPSVYGLSMQKRKMSGRVPPSFGSTRQRARGDVVAVDGGLG
jgi:hypothetical protein